MVRSRYPLLLCALTLLSGCTSNPKATASADRAGDYARQAIEQTGQAIDQQTRSVGNDIRTSYKETTSGIQRKVGDAGIASKVKAVLAADPLVAGFGIEVTSKDGIVTVEGKVKDEVTRRRSLEDVRSVEGVVGILDRLVVRSSG